MAAKQVRSIMCGCGDCCIRKNVNDTCPQGTSKEAIQLWHSDFSSDDPEGDGFLEEVAEVIEEVRCEG